MRRKAVLGMAVALVVSMTSVSAAWGHAGHGGGEPAPGSDAGADAHAGHGGGDAGGHDHGGGTPREGQEVTQGDFFPMGDGGDRVVGSAKLVRYTGGSDAVVHIGGMASDAGYGMHLHEGTCWDHGAHYRYDPNGGEGPPNELWPSSDPEDPRAGVTTDKRGWGHGEAHADWKADPVARSIHVHDEATGAMVACADLS